VPKKPISLDKLASLGFGRNQCSDGPRVRFKILARDPANIIARHFSDAVEIAFHLLPTAGGFVGADLHRLSENRILGKNESRFDLVFGFLQFTIADQADGGASLAVDGELVLDGEARWAVLDRLVWEVNELAWRGGGTRVLLHGAAVVINDQAVVMCAASGSGKSTLAGSLCARGAGYLSDEIVAYDAERSLVHPYAKPITLRAGSWPLVHLEAPPTIPIGASRTRYIPLRAAPPAPVGLVVLPAYDGGEMTTWLSPARADVLVALCEHVHELRVGGERAFRSVAQLVTGAACFELAPGDLDVACDLIFDAARAVERVR